MAVGMHISHTIRAPCGTSRRSPHGGGGVGEWGGVGGGGFPQEEGPSLLPAVHPHVGVRQRAAAPERGSKKGGVEAASSLTSQASGLCR